MRLLAFLFLLGFAVFAIGARHYYVCEIRGICAEMAEPEAEPEDFRLKSLQLTEGDSILLQGYDQFAFDSAQVMPRLNDNNSLFLDTLAALLLADTARQLNITGAFRPGEAGQSYDRFENLGLARANAIRDQLVRRGIAEERITLDYRQSDDPMLREPLTFNFYIPEETPDDYETQAFTFTNMTFSDANFEFDSDVFRPGEAFVSYADSVRTYLRLNPEKGMTIIGHTDNLGTDEYNLDLGLRRARSARAYFQELGVEADIEVESQGEKRPVAPNDSDENRQKNRRVNFVLE